MDTNFVTVALAEWNCRNGTTKTWNQLTQVERSEVIQAAQELKQNAKRACGMSGFWDDAELIHSYTRRQAIADGVLVDMEQDELGQLRREAGVKWPIAMTATAFSQYVELTPAAVKAGNDMKGRWWDILTMWKHAVKTSKHDGTELNFQFLCVVDRQQPSLVTLKAVAGPDDDGQPCLTFMLPEED